jgi:hypothetical protein
VQLEEPVTDATRPRSDIGRFARVPGPSERCRPMSISVLLRKLSADIRKLGPGLVHIRLFSMYLRLDFAIFLP